MLVLFCKVLLFKIGILKICIMTSAMVKVLLGRRPSPKCSKILWQITRGSLLQWIGNRPMTECDRQLLSICFVTSIGRIIFVISSWMLGGNRKDGFLGKVKCLRARFGQEMLRPKAVPALRLFLCHLGICRTESHI